MIRKGEGNQQNDNEPDVMQGDGNAGDASELDVCPLKCGNFRSLVSDYSSLPSRSRRSWHPDRQMPRVWKILILANASPRPASVGHSFPLTRAWVINVTALRASSD
jgi:hypothetical protein